MADLMLHPEWTELTIVIYLTYLPLDVLHLPIGKLSLIFHNKALSVSESTKSWRDLLPPSPTLYSCLYLVYPVKQQASLLDTVLWPFPTLACHLIVFSEQLLQSVILSFTLMWKVWACYFGVPSFQCSRRIHCTAWEEGRSQNLNYGGLTHTWRKSEHNEASLNQRLAYRVRA